MLLPPLSHWLAHLRPSGPAVWDTIVSILYDHESTGKELIARLEQATIISGTFPAEHTLLTMHYIYLLAFLCALTIVSASATGGSSFITCLKSGSDTSIITPDSSPFANSSLPFNLRFNYIPAAIVYP